MNDKNRAYIDVDDPSIVTIGCGVEDGQADDLSGYIEVRTHDSMVVFHAISFGALGSYFRDLSRQCKAAEDGAQSNRRLVINVADDRVPQDL